MTLVLPDTLAAMSREQVTELACRAHLGVWTEHKRRLPMTPLHWEWAELVLRERRLCVIAPREHGKALALDTPVMVPGGWTAMGALEVGDTVIGGDGRPTRVTMVSEVFTDHDCYRVTLDDGQSFVADAEHRWITHYAWRDTRVVTTEQIVADHAHRSDQRHVIDCVRVESPDVYLPIDPWCLGYWLGDGATNGASITSADPEVPGWFADAGYETPGVRADWQFYVRDLRYSLRTIGVLGNKHVPELFLWAGTQQRLELLRGLMDSDGSCTVRGQCEFTSRLEKLADGVAHLVTSLGWKPKRCTSSVSWRGERRPVYRVEFYPDEPVFRLPRKAARQRVLPAGRRSKATGRAIVGCVRTLTVPVRCIATEAGSYLIGNAVCTHNTATFTVHHLAWRSMYTPGLWSYVFSQTDDQSKEIVQKIVDTVEQTAPWMLRRVQQKNALKVQFANGARVVGAGAGKSVRGPHPDIIVGDDVLEEKLCLTELQRKRTERWWKGTVGGMAHAGTTRWVRPFPGAPWRQVTIPATKIFLVGTPFHEQDLLNSMAGNAMYKFRRYAAEYRPIDLVPGTLAVAAS